MLRASARIAVMRVRGTPIPVAADVSQWQFGPRQMRVMASALKYRPSKQDENGLRPAK